MRVSWFDETANFTRQGHIHSHVIWLLAGFLFWNIIKLFVLKLQPMALAFCSPQNVHNEVKIHNNDLLNILSFLSFLFCKPLGDRQRQDRWSQPQWSGSPSAVQPPQPYFLENGVVCTTHIAIGQVTE